MSTISGHAGSISQVDRLLTIQIAMHERASASAYIERALQLHRLGYKAAALVDARHACRLEPENTRARVLYCSLGVQLAVDAHELHEAALALLASPFADPSERRIALAAIDVAQLPARIRLDLPVAVRLTLVQRNGDSLTLEGSGPQDWIEPLGQAASRDVFAVDCMIERPASGRRTLQLRENQETACIEVEAPVTPLPLPDSAGRPRARLWIVMPLKDGGSVLARSLNSVLGNLGRLRGARLVLVDDGSEQPETRQLLEKAARQSGVQVTRTPTSLGFTGAVNHGLRQIGPGPVLLLNSDVWLPRYTLPRLLAHLQDPTVGTVTPLSNNAGSVCLLGPGKAARIPDPTTCEALATAAYRHNRGLAVDLPSGNGFAMLVSEPCLRAIGPLSSLYDSGYYEDVDFCLRASLRGWRNVAATDCFVGHEGSVTYGAQKRRFVSANHRRLVQRFPEYPTLHRQFVALDPLAAPRARLLEATATLWQAEPLDDTPKHPGAGELTLPGPRVGPIVLPLRGTVPVELTHRRLAWLRLVPQANLRACGLVLVPDHDLVAEHDASTGQLQIARANSNLPFATFDIKGASEVDFEDLEALLLGVLAGSAETGGKHAVPI